MSFPRSTVLVFCRMEQPTSLLSGMVHPYPFYEGQHCITQLPLSKGSSASSAPTELQWGRSVWSTCIGSALSLVRSPSLLPATRAETPFVPLVLLFMTTQEYLEAGKTLLHNAQMPLESFLVHGGNVEWDTPFVRTEWIKSEDLLPSGSFGELRPLLLPTVQQPPTTTTTTTQLPLLPVGRLRPITRILARYLFSDLGTAPPLTDHSVHLYVDAIHGILGKWLARPSRVPQELLDWVKGGDDGQGEKLYPLDAVNAWTQPTLYRAERWLKSVEIRPPWIPSPFDLMAWVQLPSSPLVDGPFPLKECFGKLCVYSKFIIEEFGWREDVQEHLEKVFLSEEGDALQET